MQYKSPAYQLTPSLSLRTPFGRRSPRKFNKLWLLVIAWNLLPLAWDSAYLYAQENKVEPIIVNGDTVEYSTDAREVTATGNVEVIYKGSKLSCHKITVNTQTREGIAEGNARLDDQKGVIEGEKIIYNFQTKTGTIINAQFRANPYFGRASKVEKVSDAEFIARHGYATTCSFDHPHYRIKSKQINLFPKDKIQTKENTFYLGNTPLLYLPRYNHSLTDPLMHVQVMPGKRKDWGPYLLSAWRYNLTPGIDGRVYLDYRSKLGPAGGFGLNYVTQNFGKGDYKFYYSLEKPDNLPAGAPAEYNRALMRWRHKWDIDAQTNIVSEFYKIVDDRRKKLDAQSNILKDYFFREYETDSHPLSYALFHHNFRHSSIDLLVEKRVNHWYDQLDKMPEVKYTMASLELGETPFYFTHDSSLVNFNKKAETSPVSADDVTMTRLDVTNKLSLPMKVAFLELTPFVASRQTLYDKGADASSLPIRTIFYSGADLSTKFYRIFNVNSHFLGMDINGLRHIITPTIGYSYNPEPTVSANKLKQIDSVDLLGSSNAASLGLSNKLQTKRRDKDGKEVTVDLVDFMITTSYAFSPRVVYGTTPLVLYNNTVINPTDPAKKNKLGASISDIYFKYKLLPYSWLRIEGDATYKHSGVPGDSDYENYRHFSSVNYDVNFDFAPERSFGVGQRYARKGQSQVTTSFQWRINPKWKFSIYERYNLKSYLDTSISPNVYVDQCSLEQQITLSRDLHCWDVDFTLDTKKNSGNTIYIVFRLKAFPENEFSINQDYNKPKTGSQ
jgi:LPS-assembly protein